ncbi:unnamed protein product, partial [Prorocentrum cordatum]
RLRWAACSRFFRTGGSSRRWRRRRGRPRRPTSARLRVGARARRGGRPRAAARRGRGRGRREVVARGRQRRGRRRDARAARLLRAGRLHAAAQRAGPIAGRPGGERRRPDARRGARRRRQPRSRRLGAVGEHHGPSRRHGTGARCRQRLGRARVRGGARAGGAPAAGGRAGGRRAGAAPRAGAARLDEEPRDAELLPRGRAPGAGEAVGLPAARRQRPLDAARPRQRPGVDRDPVPERGLAARGRRGAPAVRAGPPAAGAARRGTAAEPPRRVLVRPRAPRGACARTRPLCLHHLVQGQPRGTLLRALRAGAGAAAARGAGSARAERRRRRGALPGLSRPTPHPRATLESCDRPAARSPPGMARLHLNPGRAPSC